MTEEVYEKKDELTAEERVRGEREEGGGGGVVGLGYCAHLAPSAGHQRHWDLGPPHNPLCRADKRIMKCLSDRHTIYLCFLSVNSPRLCPFLGAREDLTRRRVVAIVARVIAKTTAVESSECCERSLTLTAMDMPSSS